MMTRTHLAIGLIAALFLLENVVFKFAFVVITLVASILPDMDSGFSKIGRNVIFRPIQFFSKHRGFFHSFTFCFVVTVLLAFRFPIYALPFFLGYGLHLFADSFTIDGIQPFWPLKKRAQGALRVGGHIEAVLFTFCCIGAGVLLVLHIF